MEKIDLRKEYKQLYQPSAKAPVIVEVPPLWFAMVDGAIEAGQEPGNSPAYQEAVQALYGISFTLKFMVKKRKENPVDYGVSALEGLWWLEGGEFEFTRKDNWRWTAMIMQPDVITPEIFQEGLAELKRKKPSPGVERLRFECFHEGLSVQIMHIGPYSAEPPTLERMHAFAAEQGYHLRGKHHEIYLGDPRNTDPSNLKTVLRHPVERSQA